MTNACSSQATATAVAQPDTVHRRRAALVAAEQFLADTAEAVTPDTSASELLRCAASYRAHLAILVAAMRPAPLVRTVDEAAAALGVHPMTVYRMISRGDLAAYRISKRSIRIDEPALREYLARHVVGARGLTDPDMPLRHLQSNLL